MNSISAELTPADRDAVMQAIATIKTALPFLVDLSIEGTPGNPQNGR